jgi:hypothetical protein
MRPTRGKLITCIKGTAGNATSFATNVTSKREIIRHPSMARTIKHTSQPLHGGFSEGDAAVVSTGSGGGTTPSGHSEFVDMN